MEHALHLRKLPHNRQRIGMGLPVMDNHRQPQLLRQRHLCAQYMLLPRTAGVFLPVVIQTDLTDRHHFVVPGQRAEYINVGVRKIAAVFRMNAHGGIYMVKPFRQRHRLTGGLHRTAGVDDQPHIFLRHSGKHRLTVRVKGFVVVMGMCIKQHGSSPQSK